MTETATWRREVEYMQTFHDEFGPLYEALHLTRDRILGHAFPEALEQDEVLVPMISLEAIPESRFGHWRGRFMEVGPLGFSNVISINLLAFRHAAEIPPTLAHEMCHWWDRPNTGHTDSYWKISEQRIGMDRHGMKSMTWVRLEEQLPMEDLSEIVLSVT
jgi:hypothetical protein